MSRSGGRYAGISSSVTRAGNRHTGDSAAHQSQIQPFPAPLLSPPDIDLSTILGSNLIDPITDFSGSANPTLTGTFHSQAAKPTKDGFQLDLKTGTVSSR